VQDNDPVVQKVINRIQPFENVQNATGMARKAGFTSVNFDLIYGLPFQTVESIQRTIEQVITLMPDRIAFYSYAHVPWTSKGQRLFDENDLPSPEKKILLYLKGKELLMQQGYVDIGMDHFALPHDSLYEAWDKERLHRNFMGYTTQNTGLLLGLGVSAISDTGTAYVQNTKTLHGYYAAIKNQEYAIHKGYILNEEDKLFRKNILDISCKGKTTFTEAQAALVKEFSFPQLALLAADGLVTYDEKGLELTPQGHYFIRNVCSAFDLHLQRNKTPANNPVFSKAI
jgi:oxygen-independent coproporphyrinogen-3 oxidase